MVATLMASRNEIATSGLLALIARLRAMIRATLFLIAAAVPFGPYNHPLALPPHPRLGVNERIGVGSDR